MKYVIYIVSLTILAFSPSVLSQDLQGKIYYVSKSKVNTDFGQRQLSEAQKARIKTRQNEASTKSHVLVFNNNESLFSEEVKASQNVAQNSSRSGGGGFRQFLFSQNYGTYYLNTDTKLYVAQKEIYGKQFLIQDTLPELNWQRTDEVKTIGKYLCFKAILNASKSKDSTNTNNNAPLITAWYTIEIPLSTGPETYWGLPGAILELHTENMVYLCSRIELILKETGAIKPPRKGKKIEKEEYDKLLDKKAKEIKELNQNRRFGGKN